MGPSVYSILFFARMSTPLGQCFTLRPIPWLFSKDDTGQPVARPPLLKSGSRSRQSGSGLVPVSCVRPRSGRRGGDGDVHAAARAAELWLDAGAGQHAGYGHDGGRHTTLTIRETGDMTLTATPALSGPDADDFRVPTATLTLVDGGAAQTFHCSGQFITH